VQIYIKFGVSKVFVPRVQIWLYNLDSKLGSFCRFLLNA
jgi:hypothetical protein